MIDHATIRRLAELRRQIDEAESVCGATIGAMRNAPHGAAARPFLAACASELEALAGRMRLAADQADAR